MLRSTLLCATLAAALPTPLVHAALPAQEPENAPKKPALLTVGDAAPAISIAKWIKGAPVERFEKSKVYMVEFWATWCGPCIQSMPHLSELQKKHADKGFTILSVTAPDARGNSLERVEAMVKDKGDKMAYTIAWDEERKTNDAYMRAAGQGGIPCSFLVDGNGRIAYIGHPMGIDATLELVLSGKHDIEALAAAHKREQELELRARELQGALNAAAGKGDWEAALSACDSMLALDPKKFGGVAAAKFQILVLEVKDVERAYAWTREAQKGVCKDSSEGLHGLAWVIVDPDTDLVPRDADLAIQLAARASELSNGKDASILDTLARAWFTKGDLAKAVEIQRQAVALDRRHEATLKRYEAALTK